MSLRFVITDRVRVKVRDRVRDKMRAKVRRVRGKFNPREEDE